MSSRATYQCTALVGTNKKGKLAAGADGYYDVVLGALDYYNSTGAFYAYSTAKKLFDESSMLQRRIQKGVLRGELGHPKYIPGMDKKAFLARVMEVHETNVSHHIKEVTIDSDSVKDSKGGSVIAIMGRIKPCGPMGDTLAASLENEHENVFFSIRSFTDDIIDSTGRRVKNLMEVITWDYVNEGGLAIANKYAAPTLESYQSVGFTKENLILAANMANEAYSGMESDVKSGLRNVVRSFGWDKESEQRKSNLILPGSARW